MRNFGLMRMFLFEAELAESEPLPVTGESAVIGPWSHKVTLLFICNEFSTAV
jgi:hypothetical protein